MSTMQRQDVNEPLTYMTAPRIEHQGKTYLQDDAALVLMERIAEEEKDLLDALAAQ